MARQNKIEIHLSNNAAPAPDFGQTSTLAYIGELSAELAVMARKINSPALADLLEEAKFHALGKLMKGMSDEGAA